MNARFAFILPALLFLSGCLLKQPQFVVAPGTSLAGYKDLEVAPVSNQTGQAFDSLSFIEQLESALRFARYNVSDTNPSPQALIVQCAIIEYFSGGGVLKPGVTVRTTLVAKSSGETIAALLTNTVAPSAHVVVVGSAGLSFVLANQCTGNTYCVQRMAADEVAAAIDRSVKGS